MKTRLISLFLSAAMLLSAVPAMAETTTTQSNDNIVYDIDFLPEEKQTIRYWAVSTFGSDLAAFSKDDYGMSAQYYREMGANFIRAWIPLTESLNEDGSISDEKFLKLYNQALGYLQKAGIKEWQWIIENDMPEGSYYYDSRNWRKFTPEGYDIYCDYIIGYLKIMKKYGLIMPVAVGFINEPNSVSQNAVGEDYKLLAKTMKKKMVENGFGDILLAGPEAAAIPQIEPIIGSWEDFKADSEYSDAIDIMTYHSYYQANERYNEIVKEFAQTMKNDFPEKEVWMTELCVLPGNDVSREGNYAFNVGMHMIRTMCADIAWCGANSWMVHGGVTTAMGLYEDGFMFENGVDYQALDNGTQGYGADLNNTFTALPYYWMIREVCKKAPAGSVVHPMRTNDPDIVNSYAPLTDLLGLKTKTGQLEIIANPTEKVKYYNLNNLEGKSAVIKQISSENPGMFDISYRNIQDNSIKNVCLPPYTLMYVETTDEDLAAPMITEETKEKFIYNEDNKYYIREKEAEFTVTLDEVARVTVNGKAYKLDENNQLKLKLDIKDGNKYEIKAADKECNTSERTVMLEYRPDFVSLVLDEYIANSTTGTYKVCGMSNALGTVSCNGIEAEVDENHRFEITCKLAEGMNELVVTAKDQQGNLSEPKTVRVLCDSIAPTITLNQKSINTEFGSIVIAGKVSEELNSLKVSDNEVSVAHDNSFSCIVHVNEPQQVRVEAVDMYGNTSAEYVQINYAKTENSPHRVDGQMYARSTKNQIKLDGEFNEGYKLDIVADKSVEGIVNNIVKWGAMWDSNNLYIAADVQDSAVCFSGEHPYNSDCIEIFLNPSAERKGSYVDKDRQLWSAYVNNSSALYKNTMPFNSAWKLTEDGYQVEIAIPWSSIGISPQDGTKIGFDITCNDNDEGGLNRQSVVTWNGTGQNWATTADFGLVILSVKDEVEYLDKQETEAEDKQEEISSYNIELDGELLEWKAVRLNNQIMLPAAVIEKAIGSSFKWSIGNTFSVELEGGHSLFVEIYSNQVIYDGEAVPVTSTAVTEANEVYIPPEIMEKFFRLTFTTDGDKIVLKKM